MTPFPRDRGRYRRTGTTVTLALRSRARLRAMAYRMLGSASDADDAVQEGWLRAARAGADRVVLDPDVVLHADAAASPAGRPAELHGATAVANGAWLAAQRSRESALVLVDGVPGIVYAPHGKVAIVLAFRYRDDRIAGIEVIADAGRLDALELAVVG